MQCPNKSAARKYDLTILNFTYPVGKFDFSGQNSRHQEKLETKSKTSRLMHYGKLTRVNRENLSKNQRRVHRSDEVTLWE